MTEHIWLTTTYPSVMLSMIKVDVHGYSVIPIPHMQSPRISDRKLWLFIAAVEREWWGDKASRNDLYQIDWLEKIAEGQSKWESHHHPVFTYWLTGNPLQDAIRCVAHHNTMPEKWSNLLRCIIGNPWIGFLFGSEGLRITRPFISIEMDLGVWDWYSSSKWNNGTVPRMAQSIYADRDFNGYGALIDALLESGCPETFTCPGCKGTGKREWNTPLPFSIASGTICGYDPMIAPGSGRSNPVPIQLASGPSTFQSGLFTVPKEVLSSGPVNSGAVLPVRQPPPGITLSCIMCNGRKEVDNPITEHLRSKEPHAKGCWVLDLFLGYNLPRT